MKYLNQLFIIALSAIAVTPAAHAQIIDVSHNKVTSNQAAALMTQPVTLHSEAGNTIEQNDRLKQITNSIQPVHTESSKSINPIDFFKDPSASLKQFFQENQDDTPQKIDPLESSKTPPLDSETIGKFNVQVSHF
jgi:hypothetical protein